MLNAIFANRILQYIKYIYIMTKYSLFLESKDDFDQRVF